MKKTLIYSIIIALFITLIPGNLIFAQNLSENIETKIDNNIVSSNQVHTIEYKENGMNTVESN